MQRELAEWLAADIERNELQECSLRLDRCRIVAAATHGQEREELLRQADAAEAELRQWSNLVSVVRGGRR